ncbi:hypothetical protein FF2_034229 [Malus domestica]
MLECKPISTPAISGRRLSVSDGEPLSDITEFHSIVGALQYLLFTRLDIAFAINQVSTPNHGIVYCPSSLQLTAYANADYAGDPNDRRSTGGYCIFLGDNLISWSSKEQRGVSHSSIEAGYLQLAYIAAALSWYHTLFQELHLPLAPPHIWCDNISVIFIASNPIYQQCMQHF